MMNRTSGHLDTPISRRSLLVGAIAIPSVAALIAACGDRNSAGTDSTDDTGSTTPGTTPGTGGSGDIAHPTGADDAVLRIAYEGGFVAPGFRFSSPPTLLVSGDGRAFTPAAIPEIYPGPLVMPVMVQSITEAGMQTLLGLADGLGLLATPPDYPPNPQIADAPDTVVTLTAKGGTFVHRAYALFEEQDETDPNRKKLIQFVTKATDLATTVGAAELGEAALFEAKAYRVQAWPVAEADISGGDIPPTILDWPASTGLDLTTANVCATVTAAAVGSLLADAKQNTYFRQADVLYRVSAAALLPGESC